MHKTGSYIVGLWQTSGIESFQNTLLTWFCWVLFPIEDIKLAVETTKRILTKEKIDKQLAGQSSSTPVMRIKDGYNGKKVTLDMQDSLDDKIGKLTLIMSKLITQDNNQDKQFKLKIYQGRQKGQSRNNYPDHTNHQIRYRSNSRDRRTSFRCRGQYGQNYRGRLCYINNYRNDYKDNFRGMQGYRGQNFRGGYRRNYRNDNFERGRSRSRERQYLGNFSRNDRSSSRSRWRLRASLNRDRIRCFKCREYDHFAKECLNSHIEKEPEKV